MFLGPLASSTSSSSSPLILPCHVDLTCRVEAGEGEFQKYQKKMKQLFSFVFSALPCLPLTAFLYSSCGEKRSKSRRHTNASLALFIFLLLCCLPPNRASPHIHTHTSGPCGGCMPVWGGDNYGPSRKEAEKLQLDVVSNGRPYSYEEEDQKIQPLA